MGPWPLPRTQDRKGGEDGAQSSIFHSITIPIEIFLAAGTDSLLPVGQERSLANPVLDGSDEVIVTRMAVDLPFLLLLRLLLLLQYTLWLDYTLD